MQPIRVSFETGHAYVHIVTYSDKWPLITERELRETGPWPLKPYQYLIHTFWPWTTGIEMLARSRFNQVEECNILISKLTSSDKKNVGINTF